MAIWDKVKQSIDKAGKAAQDVFDEGKLRIDAYRARELADKAAEALGYAVFRAAESGGELETEAKSRLMNAMREREMEARKLEAELAAERAAAGQSEPPPPPPDAAPEPASPPPPTPPPASASADMPGGPQSGGQHGP